MTASIENLIEEQKEKQRLQNELTIAQEVQAQLFPAAFFAAGFAGSFWVLPSGAHRERRLLRFPRRWIPTSSFWRWVTSAEKAFLRPC